MAENSYFQIYHNLLNCDYFMCPKCNNRFNFSIELKFNLTVNDLKDIASGDLFDDQIIRLLSRFKDVQVIDERSFVDPCEDQPSSNLLSYYDPIVKCLECNHKALLHEFAFYGEYYD